jgi:AhpD family alkylhydroperoxidase
MPHINLPDHPGILALLAYKPTTAASLNMLTEALLRGPSPLSVGERELIASFVSWQNACDFCFNVHSRVAAIKLESTFEKVTDIIKHYYIGSRVGERIKNLLTISSVVRSGCGKPTIIRDAIAEVKERTFITDEEIHDTVLITSAFCMFNRYVDGLGTNSQIPESKYLDLALHLVNKGYLPQ